MNSRIIALAFALSVPLTTASAQNGNQYDLVDLSGIRSGDEVHLTAINENGLICGYSVDSATNEVGAFRYDAVAGPLLATNLLPLPNYDHATAMDVSASGMVVGYSTDNSGNSMACYWNPGSVTATSIGTLGGGWSWATGVAYSPGNGDIICGTSQTGDQPAQAAAFTYSVQANFLRRLPDEGSFPNEGCWANAINADGLVAGESQYNGLIEHRAARWDQFGLHHSFFWSGGANTSARDLNQSGSMVGWGDNASGERRPLIWAPGGQELPLPAGFTEGQATAINSVGQAVGFADGGSFPGQDRALLWENGVVKELNSLTKMVAGSGLEMATDLNDEGWILGSGYRNQGQRFVFLLKPSLRVFDPLPGAAGANNHFQVTGGTPGEDLYLAYGDTYGFSQVPSCTNLYLGIHSPASVGPKSVDWDGTALFTQFVPASAYQQTYLFQALEPASCRVSNLRSYTFQ